MENRKQSCLTLTFSFNISNSSIACSSNARYKTCSASSSLFGKVWGASLQISFFFPHKSLMLSTFFSGKSMNRFPAASLPSLVLRKHELSISVLKRMNPSASSFRMGPEMSRLKFDKSDKIGSLMKEKSGKRSSTLFWIGVAVKHHRNGAEISRTAWKHFEAGFLSVLFNKKKKKRKGSQKVVT